MYWCHVAEAWVPTAQFFLHRPSLLSFHAPGPLAHHGNFAWHWPLPTPAPPPTGKEKDKDKDKDKEKEAREAAALLVPVPPPLPPPLYLHVEAGDVHASGQGVKLVMGLLKAQPAAGDQGTATRGTQTDPPRLHTRSRDATGAPVK